MVEQRICRMIENVINYDVNAVLATMPLKVRFNCRISDLILILTLLINIFIKIRINEDNLDIIGKTFGVDATDAPHQPLTNPNTSPSSVPYLHEHQKKKLKSLTPKNITLLNFVNQLRDRNRNVFSFVLELLDL